MSKVDPYPPLITVAGTAPCPRNTLTNREFASELARRTAAEEDWLDTSPFEMPRFEGDPEPEPEYEGTPYYRLTLPWEAPCWPHLIQRRRWRKRHERIHALELAAGMHTWPAHNVLPWRMSSTWNDDLDLGCYQ